ncbi:MAG: hypothetical protein AB1405_16365 [Bdellovibrionota bacterium]
MKRPVGRILWMTVLLVATTSACDEETLSALGLPGPGGNLLVLNSDFTDTTVSLVDRLTREVLEPELTGSFGSPPLLSGDVVPARNASATGEVLLIDRGNANVTFVDPETGGIARQFTVRTESSDGNPNPSDVLVYSATKMYVSRQGRCARETPDPFGFCDVVSDPPVAFDLTRSNDVVIMNPQTGELTEVPAFDFTGVFGAAGTGQIDTANGDVARPSQLIPVGDYIAVVLLNLDVGVDGTGGVGLVALIDPATDTLVDATPAATPLTVDPAVLQVSSDECKSPGGDRRTASVLAGEDVLYIACSGIFDSTEGGYASQLADSRIVKVDFSPLSDVSPGDAVVTEVLDIGDLYPGEPTTAQAALTGQIQIVSETLGFVTTYGAFSCFSPPCDSTAPASDFPAALFSFDPSTPGAVNTEPLVESVPFGLEGMLADPATKTLYLCDNNYLTTSQIRVFDYLPAGDGSTPDPVAEVPDAGFVPNSRPGQAPREIVFY